MSDLFRPVRNDRLSDRVAQQLLAMMRAGELPAGARLPPEGQLAEQLGVSRGILREALTVLQARGMLRRTPKEGTFVTGVGESGLGQSLASQLRAATYQDLLEFREVMECRVVQNAVLRATDADIQALREMLEAGYDSASVQSPDYYFHYRLAELSGNALFMAFIDTYYDLIHEMKAATLRDEKRVGEVQKEHLRIVDAIARRSERAAVNAVRQHLRAVGRAVQAEETEE